ncbi:MAG: amidohydrolase family protein [Rikenellaceae bacterium]
MSYSSLSHRKIASNLMAMGGEFIPRPLIEIDSDGTIISVEQYEDIDRIHSAEFYSGIMTAGFVNTHAHMELSYLRGKITPHKGFAEFARQIGEVRGEATLDERLRAIEKEDLTLRTGGVVAVGDILNGNTSMDCKSKSPIRYRNFGEVFGLKTTSFEDLLWCEDYPNSSITPHSIYSLNDQLFKNIASRNIDHPLSIHFQESPAEAELFERRGRLWEWYQTMGFECDFLHYGSPAERIINSVPHDRTTLLVHNCCVTQRDIDTIMRHFTAPVYWVLCPKSNDYISRLTPPVELLHANNLNICVGTDSLASNDSLSILEEIAMFPEVPLAQRIDWATHQGAKALGFSDLGELKVGYRPGINIISGVDYRTMQITSQTRISCI